MVFILAGLVAVLLLPMMLRQPAILVWQGNTQQFGARENWRGNPQKWVNILGHVRSAIPVSSLSYSLNGGQQQALRVGPDNRRLAGPGEFNVELDIADLLPGDNEVLITAVDGLGGSSRQLVVVNYLDDATGWAPNKYTFDWGTVAKVENMAVVVDGDWAIDGDSVRPVELDYDRLLALGDLSWRDYTVTVPVTFYDIDPLGFLSPSNGPGVGVIVRWRGHQDAGSRGPVDGWSYLGALGWYRWQQRAGDFSEGLQLIGHGGRELGANDRKLEPGITYTFKINVESSSDPAEAAFYRFKVWPASEVEPVAWDLESRGHVNEPPAGSLLLVAHHVDARFGPVQVELFSVDPVAPAGG